MVDKFVQNTCTHNMRKTIHNYLINVQSKKTKQPTIDSNNISPIVTKDYNILESQGLLEHNDLTNKPITKIE
jgi:hypothetical protein